MFFMCFMFFICGFYVFNVYPTVFFYYTLPHNLTTLPNFNVVLMFFFMFVQCSCFFHVVQVFVFSCVSCFWGFVVCLCFSCFVFFTCFILLFSSRPFSSHPTSQFLFLCFYICLCVFHVGVVVWEEKGLLEKQ